MLPPMAIPSVWPRPRKKENMETAKARCWGWVAAWSWVWRDGKSLDQLVSLQRRPVNSSIMQDLHAKTNTDDQICEHNLRELCLGVYRA
jgi:hypothetical protein